MDVSLVIERWASGSVIKRDEPRLDGQAGRSDWGSGEVTHDTRCDLQTGCRCHNVIRRPV